jgi:hypothetical protein
LPPRQICDDHVSVPTTTFTGDLLSGYHAEAIPVVVSQLEEVIKLGQQEHWLLDLSEVKWGLASFPKRSFCFLLIIDIFEKLGPGLFKIACKQVCVFMLLLEYPPSPSIPGQKRGGPWVGGAEEFFFRIV